MVNRKCEKCDGTLEYVKDYDVEYFQCVLK